MDSLHIWLLGAPRLEINGTPAGLNRQKALAILAYLAVTGEPQSRDKLATMFWPDSSQSLARASLRRDLSVLNKALNGRWLIIDRETIGLKRIGLWLDTLRFQELLDNCEPHDHPQDPISPACLTSLTEAVTLYRDDFLTGFSLSDAPEFDEWQYFHAEELRQAFGSTLQRLVMGHQTQDEYETALTYARRWLALDTLHEPAHRTLMTLYAQSGQHAAALRQYQVCAQTLQDELAISPSSETEALFHQIQAERGQDGSPERQAVPKHNLPAPATGFVGREAQLAEIDARLRDADCRILTLTGPGGVGKTRLALQAAWNLEADANRSDIFPDGLFYIRLTTTTALEQVITAVAGAINFNFFNRDVAHVQQLIHYVRDKRLLLVLDNFEHLIDAAADFIGELLATAPGLKLLVTSREALNLQEEWLLSVEGMRYPTKADGADRLTEYSAVQLFVQNAKRVRPDFSIADDERCVVQICRRVEGMPLALELAAAWLKVLPCTEIAQDLERSFDLLTTTLRNVPERHRSMRIVFEHSWQRLSEQEQLILQNLSVFRGGFRQNAAAQVAGASLMQLAALVEKSLVKVLGHGRYLLHNLLRQFVSEKLAENRAGQTEIQIKHSDFYIDLLQTQAERLQGRDQKIALEQIRQESGNVRSAWRVATEHQNLDAIAQAVDPLFEFYWISSRYREGAALFQATAEHLKPNDLPETLAVKLTARQGAFQAALGVYGFARELLQSSLSQARHLSLPAEIIFSLDQLGKLTAVQGESLVAEHLYQESLKLSRAEGRQTDTANALYNLGWVAAGQGEYPIAKQYFSESLSIHRAVENEVGIGHVLDSIGTVSFFLGEYTAAAGHFRESFAIFEALVDQQGMARAISGLGLVNWGLGGEQLPEARRQLEESIAINRAIGHRLEVARRLGYLGAVANRLRDYDSAETYHTEALAISREIGFLFGVPWSLVGLGATAAGRGDPQTAHTYFFEALEIAIQSHTTSILPSALTYLADLKRAEGQVEAAVKIITAVIQYPATWQIVKDRASQLSEELKIYLDAESFQTALEFGNQASIIDIALDLLGNSKIRL